MNIVFLGPPGAGKGTHAIDFSKVVSAPHISTGDIFREAVKNETPVGMKAKGYMDRGELVPDEIVVEVVLERLEQPDCKGGFILDGFPRNLAQAEKLSQTDKVSLDSVIYFETSKEVILNRLTGRLLCSKCGRSYHVKNYPPQKEGVCDDCGEALYQRDDDCVETIENRLKVYNEETKALIDYYREKNLLAEINGDLAKPKVQEKLRLIFNKLKSRSSC